MKIILAVSKLIFESVSQVNYSVLSALQLQLLFKKYGTKNKRKRSVLRTGYQRIQPSQINHVLTNIQTSKLTLTGDPTQNNQKANKASRYLNQMDRLSIQTKGKRWVLQNLTPQVSFFECVIIINLCNTILRLIVGLLLVFQIIFLDFSVYQ